MPSQILWRDDSHFIDPAGSLGGFEPGGSQLFSIISAALYQLRYQCLLDTKDKGIVFRPDMSKGLECFVGADFAGSWKDGDHDLPESVLSKTAYVIMYAGCPITWGSKIQTEIALSTTESEYIALSTAMREVVPFMGLMKEIADCLAWSLGNLSSSALSGKITTVVSLLTQLPNSSLVQNILPSNTIT